MSTLTFVALHEARQLALGRRITVAVPADLVHEARLKVGALAIQIVHGTVVYDFTLRVGSQVIDGHKHGEHQGVGEGPHHGPGCGVQVGDGCTHRIAPLCPYLVRPVGRVDVAHGQV